MKTLKSIWKALEVVEAVASTILAVIWNITIAVVAIVAIIWIGATFGLLAGILAFLIIPSVATTLQTWS